MARTQRSTVTPAQVYALHAEEARAALSGAVNDDQRASLGAAASAHDTAARLHQHAERNDRRANAYRQSASTATARRALGLADQFNAEADALESGAAFARERAENWHARGHEHTRAAAAEAALPDEEPARRRRPRRAATSDALDEVGSEAEVVEPEAAPAEQEAV